MSAWKNSDTACCTVVIGVAGGAVVAVERPVQQAVPERLGVRVASQDLHRLGGRGRVGDPLQDVLEGLPGQGRGVEVALQHLRRLGGVEPGSIVAGAAGDRTLDGAGGEGLGAPLGDLGVHAAGDRVPDQLVDDALGQAERVEDHARPVVAGAFGEAEQQVLDLRQGDQGSARGAEQRRGEQVEGLAGALRADHAGGAVPRHPQLAATRLVRVTDAPAHVPRVEPQLHRSLLRPAAVQEPRAEPVAELRPGLFGEVAGGALNRCRRGGGVLAVEVRADDAGDLAEPGDAQQLLGLGCGRHAAHAARAPALVGPRRRARWSRSAARPRSGRG